jgi:hypothetical protein
VSRVVLLGLSVPSIAFGAEPRAPQRAVAVAVAAAGPAYEEPEPEPPLHLVERDRRLGPVRDEPAYGRAAIEMLGILSIGFGQYWANAGGNQQDWDFPHWSDRLSARALRFDNNTQVTNNVLHPLAGAAYYGFARANGLGVGGAALYGFVSSAAWEWLLEWREKVSINDLVTTPVGGIAAGEFLVQLASYLNSAPTETNLAQDVAKTTLGFPVWVHDQLDDRRPDPTPASDNLGFSSEYYHRFSLGYQNAWLDDAAELEQQIGGVVLDARLVSLPGYLDPETFQTVFAQGNFSSGSLQLQFDGDGLRDANLKFDAVLAGYYAQQARPAVLGVLAGVATGLEFVSRDTLDQGDQYALVHVAGPELGTTCKWRDFQLDLRARGYADFAAIRSLAWPEVRSTDPTAVYKSSLERQYQYHVGISTRLAAELRVYAARFFAELGWGSYRSIQGFDRFQEQVTRDPGASEVFDEHRVGLALEPPGTPLRFFSALEGYKHESSMAARAARRQERRLAIGAGLVF